MCQCVTSLDLHLPLSQLTQSTLYTHPTVNSQQSYCLSCEHLVVIALSQPLNKICTVKYIVSHTVILIDVDYYVLQRQVGLPNLFYVSTSNETNQGLPKIYVISEIILLLQVAGPNIPNVYLVLTSSMVKFKRSLYY